MRAALVVPTLNAGVLWSKWLQATKGQLQFSGPIVVVDSNSDDVTAEHARMAGCHVITIPRWQFNHGSTRQLAVENHVGHADVVVFLTQDAIPAHVSAFRDLLGAFNDPMVGAAYGRQLPHQDAGPIGAHARLFNYPEQSRVTRQEDITSLGIKAAFLSNSFAAYRREALLGVGGFPSNTILSEDTYVAAKMLLAGWSIAYRAEAKVHHSHDYSLAQEFRRYFDIGVFHAREAWIREKFGAAEGEGKRFVESELKYLWRVAPWLIPSAMLRTVIKYAGYRLGVLERHLPLAIKQRMSMHSRYWTTERGSPQS